MRVFVAGRARTKGSLKVIGYRPNGSAILSEQVAGSKAWRATLAHVILRSLGASIGPRGPVVDWEPWDGPVVVRMLTFLPRKSGRTEPYPILRTDGDTDKYQRNTGDALQDTRLIVDDGQIVDWIASKRWAQDRQMPGSWIEVRIP
jgi:hypothetical protein